MQMHILVDEEEWQTAFGAHGALEYLAEAKEEGLVRFLGVTGHGLSVARMHQRSLDEYAFDAVRLPWNYPMSRNEEYAREFRELRDRCVESGTAVQTIRSIANGPSGERERSRSTWYEPLEAQNDIDRAVFWLLSHPNLFLNTVGDIDLLPLVIDATERFSGQRPGEEEMHSLAKAADLEPLLVE